MRQSPARTRPAKGAEHDDHRNRDLLFCRHGNALGHTARRGGQSARPSLGRDLRSQQRLCLRDARRVASRNCAGDRIRRGSPPWVDHRASGRRLWWSGSTPHRPWSTRRVVASGAIFRPVASRSTARAHHRCPLKRGGSTRPARSTRFSCGMIPSRIWLR